ncbi:unnamed protein product [Ceratitis capitata]|uniref:(Mediterranean fruit fly) hypothetical protein n=1 Tax=Ceratitis capitata TaxID=7213 RepID=A0A811UNM0_CERCA|nr:unnamed protein product [Ceratitis capitata]
MLQGNSHFSAETSSATTTNKTSKMCCPRSKQHRNKDTYSYIQYIQTALATNVRKIRKSVQWLVVANRRSSSYKLGLAEFYRILPLPLPLLLSASFTCLLWN